MLVTFPHTFSDGTTVYSVRHCKDVLSSLQQQLDTITGYGLDKDPKCVVLIKPLIRAITSFVTQHERVAAMFPVTLPDGTLVYHIEAADDYREYLHEKMLGDPFDTTEEERITMTELTKILSFEF